MNPTTNQLWTGVPPAAGELPKKDPPLRSELQRLRAEIDDLHKSLDVLTDRLGPVIPKTDESMPIAQRDSYGNSPVVLQVYELSCMVQTAGLRLSFLMQRLEV